jgi:hypothetical protein
MNPCVLTLHNLHHCVLVIGHFRESAVMYMCAMDIDYAYVTTIFWLSFKEGVTSEDIYTLANNK